jgi:CRP-like cAMP-binding protein
MNNHDESASQTAPFKELAELGFAVETLASLGPAIAATRLVHYDPNDTIYRESDEVESLYVISEGRIKLLNHLENGRSRIVRLHNRGSTIGLNGLMDEPHSHTAIAIDNVTAYQIPMHLIKTVKDEDPDAYCQLLEFWHEYLKMADTWITDFSTGAIRGRVARLIRFLVENDEATGPRDVTLLTVDEMADVLGVTPESVSRIMADLKRRKILQAMSDLPDNYQCNIERLLKETEK